MRHNGYGMLEENKFFLFLLAFIILTPLSMFESMRHISYISLTAIVSIGIALIYILISDVDEINNPDYDKTLKWMDLSQIPYFFGIAMFMFEGNAVSLEIYH